MGRMYTGAVTSRQKQDQYYRLQGTDLRHCGMLEERLNTFRVASIRWGLIAGIYWQLGDTRWWTQGLHPAALRTTVPPAGDPFPNNSTKKSILQLFCPGPLYHPFCSIVRLRGNCNTNEV